MRLIVVDFTASESLRMSEFRTTVAVTFEMGARVIVPRTLWSEPAQPGVVAAPNTIGFSTLVSERMRVYAGEVDASDPSRFTIKYEVDGDTAYFEGKLLDNDTVEMQAMSRPSHGS